MTTFMLIRRQNRFRAELARRPLRINRSNPQARFIKSLNNLLSKKLGLFNSTLRVGMSFEKSTNCRGNDGVHLVRIIHLLRR